MTALTPAEFYTNENCRWKAAALLIEIDNDALRVVRAPNRVIATELAVT